MEINLTDLETLIRGERLPINRAEELFIRAYKAGLSDELLIFTLLELRDIFEGLESNEKDYFILGFCLGQKHLKDAEDDGENFTNNKTNYTQ